MNWNEWNNSSSTFYGGQLSLSKVCRNIEIVLLHWISSGVWCGRRQIIACDTANLTAQRHTSSSCLCWFCLISGRPTFIAWAFLWNISSMSLASLFTRRSPSISSTRTARSNSLYFWKKANHTFSGHSFCIICQVLLQFGACGMEISYHLVGLL